MVIWGINMRVIGLTGHPSSGKDIIAGYLETKGFEHISTGDILREEMKKRGIPTDRLRMHNFANEMRALRGPGYLAEEAASRATVDTVISGLRNVHGIEILRKRFGRDFTLVAIDAPVELRYGWAQGRGRDGDGLSLEQFEAQEEVERHGRPGTQQVDDVIMMVDYAIQNTGTRDELLEKINEVVINL